MRDGLKLQGTFNFEHYRGGALLEARSVRNLIVNGGYRRSRRADPADWYHGALCLSRDRPEHAGGRIHRHGPLCRDCRHFGGGGNRGLASLSRVTTDITNDTAQIAKTFTFTTTGSYAITEAAVFNAVTTSSGTMLCRQIFAAINVVATDVLNLTYRLDMDYRDNVQPDP